MTADNNGWPTGKLVEKTIGKQFDPAVINTDDPADIRMATILADEIEKARAEGRLRLGTAPRGLLGTSYYVTDILAWDELISPELIIKLASRTGTTWVAAIDFIIGKCKPDSWRTLFYMKAYLEAIVRSESEHERRLVVEVAKLGTEMQRILKEKSDDAASAKARAAAEALHSKPNGTRERRASILARWASGTFSTRHLCADQEWESCGFADVIAARRTLQGTPNPDPWPAKKVAKRK